MKRIASAEELVEIISRRNNVSIQDVINMQNDELYLDSSDEEELKNMCERDRQEILYSRREQIRRYGEQVEINEKVGALKGTSGEKRNVNIEDQIEMIRPYVLSRDLIVKNIYKPCIDRIVGCFVNVKISGKYFLAKITGIGREDVYSVVLEDNSSVKTDRQLHLDTGHKLYTNVDIKYVSNSPITINELIVYVKYRPSDINKGVERKYRAVVSAMEKEMTEDERVKYAEEKGKFLRPRKKDTYRKIELIRKFEDAVKAGNLGMVEEIQAQIDKIDASRSPSADVWAEISERNRRFNAKMSETKRTGINGKKA